MISALSTYHHRNDQPTAESTWFPPVTLFAHHSPKAHSKHRAQQSHVLTISAHTIRMRAAARSSVQHGVFLGECVNWWCIATCARRDARKVRQLMIMTFRLLVLQQVAANKRPKRTLGSSHAGNSSIGHPSSRANRQSNAGIIEANRNVSSLSITLVINNTPLLLWSVVSAFTNIFPSSSYLALVVPQVAMQRPSSYRT
jgi:hypothetical protein